MEKNNAYEVKFDSIGLLPLGDVILVYLASSTSLH